MGAGWHEWPLILFTVLGQCVVGGFVVMALALIWGPQDEERRRRIQRMMGVLWALMAIAFIASVMHLGSPLLAVNALSKIGASALSNEIAIGALFFAVGGLSWLLAVMGKTPASLDRFLLAATMALGVLFVWAMTRVYQIDTVPTWHNGYTTLGFFMTMLIGGPLLGYLLLCVAGVTDRAMNFVPAVSIVAALVGVIGAAVQGVGLADIHSSVQQASALVPDFGGLMIWRSALLALGLGCWIVPLLKEKTPSAFLLSVCLALVIAGEFIGRAVFYGLHMTVGMAVAS